MRGGECGSEGLSRRRTEFEPHSPGGQELRAGDRAFPEQGSPPAWASQSSGAVTGRAVTGTPRRAEWQGAAHRVYSLRARPGTGRRRCELAGTLGTWRWTRRYTRKFRRKEALGKPEK